MKIYYVSKTKLLRAVLTLLLICSAIVASLPYKEQLLNVFNQVKEIPIYSVDAEQKKIAITFDCAWGGDDIPQIVDILKKYNVRATFFCVGTWIDKYPENIKLLYKEGHEVANHSDNHMNMADITEEKMKSEIINTNNKIEKLTGCKNIIFRAPYGSYNDRLMKTAKGLGQYTIQWDVDSLDWKELGVESIVNRIKSKVKSGSIILFHNDTKYTLQALPSVLENLESQGYTFVKVSVLILKENFYIDHEGRQHSLIKDNSNLD
jgi:polysaccharide deacetylase family sporulation protein PdaB